MASENTTTKPVHGAPKPQNVPADMVAAPPVPCGFAVGDLVTYTNDYGVSFNKVVRGFAATAYSYGFVYLDLDCWWSPVQPESLCLRGGEA